MDRFIPKRTEDDCIVLPAGIDFRAPGQLSPWRDKSRLEQQGLARQRGLQQLADIMRRQRAVGFFDNPHIDGLGIRL